MNVCNRRFAAYTILELLVAISIILLLCAFIFMGLTKLRERTKNQQAQTLIQKLSSAIENYNLAFHDYPPATGPGGETSSQALNYYLTSSFRTKPDATKGEKYATINYGPATSLEEIEKGPPLAGTVASIMDPWKSPLVFRYEPRPMKDPLTGVVTNVQVPLLYSVGTNKVDDTLPKNSPNDDISLGQ